MDGKLNNVIILSGPTATGKTSLAIEIHRRFPQCEIVNFDSLCFFQELSIGTAKPDENELKAAPHHLVNTNSITEKLNAADFCEMAKDKIIDLHQNKKVPILVGGSAFYLRALIKGMYIENDDDQSEKVAPLYEQNGIESIIEYLKNHDPKSLENIHQNDHYRLQRAMIFHLSNGKKISDQKKSFDQIDPYDFNQNQFDWNTHHIYLDIDKDEHWEIIHRRTNLMIQTGLIQEVQDLLNKGFSSKLKPLQSIGYKQVIEFLAQDKSEQKELIELIYIATRRLAKSQRTFFKKIHPKFSYHPLKDQNKIFEDLKVFFL